ncbi:MAG: hypothetical protein ACPLXS_02755 [Candidatus Micrarchaeales archaeon]
MVENMKGFIYTLLVFIIFMAIITIAFTFISIYTESYRRSSLEAGGEAIEEVLNSLVSNANSFGSYSLSKAISALLNYTYSKRVMIPSPSFSIAYLMQNGSFSSLAYDNGKFGVGPWGTSVSGWPDPNAHWIWDRPSRGNVPVGSVYFKKTFFVPTSTSITIYATCDDIIQLFLDGNKVINGSNSGATFSYSTTINAGTHVIWVNGTNIGSSPNPAGCLISVRSSSGATLLSSDGTWQALGYPSTPPRVNVVSFPVVWMQNAFFGDYNSSIANLLLRRFINSTILQKGIEVFQDSPFSVKAKYIERVILSFYGQNIIDYGIPVNATFNINNSLDPLFLMNGMYRRINLAPTNYTFAVYWYGSSGSGFIFAPFYYAGEKPTCSSINAFIPSGVVPSQIVIVARNAAYITNSTCTAANNFGGLVTSAITNAPTVPYVIIPSSSSFYSSFSNAQKYLLIGVSPVNSSFHAVADISGIRNALFNNLYFTSPSAPSYLQRFSNLTNYNYTLNTSTFGIFSFYGLSHKDAIDYKYFSYPTQPTLFEVLGMPNCENSTICSSAAVPHFCLDNQTMVNIFGQLTTTLQYLNVSNIVISGCP